MLFFFFFIRIDGNLFSATVADFSSMDPIIYKEQLQTEQYDSLSLNGKIKNLSRFSILLKNICSYIMYIMSCSHILRRIYYMCMFSSVERTRTVS